MIQLPITVLPTVRIDLVLAAEKQDIGLVTLGSLATAVTTAVLGALTVMFQDWRKRRNRAELRRKAVVDATNYVGFVDRWFQVQQRAGIEPAQREAREWATNELERTRSLLAAMLVANPSVPHDQRNPIQKALLLYEMRTLKASVSQICYWVITLIVMLGIVLTVTPPTWDSWYRVLVFFIIGSPAPFFRALAIHLDERATWPKPTDAPKPRPVEEQPAVSAGGSN